MMHVRLRTKMVLLSATGLMAAGPTTASGQAVPGMSLTKGQADSLRAAQAYFSKTPCAPERVIPTNADVRAAYWVRSACTDAAYAPRDTVNSWTMSVRVKANACPNAFYDFIFVPGTERDYAERVRLENAFMVRMRVSEGDLGMFPDSYPVYTAGISILMPPNHFVGVGNRMNLRGLEGNTRPDYRQAVLDFRCAFGKIGEAQREAVSLFLANWRATVQ